VNAGQRDMLEQPLPHLALRTGEDCARGQLRMRGHLRAIITQPTWLCSSADQFQDCWGGTPT
jgi:hypothetical protein